MSIKRRLIITDLDDVKAVFEEVLERIEGLEKVLKLVYHNQNKSSRTNASSMHDINTSLTDANRKITKISKK